MISTLPAGPVTVQKVDECVRALSKGKAKKDAPTYKAGITPSAILAVDDRGGDRLRNTHFLMDVTAVRCIGSHVGLCIVESSDGLDSGNLPLLADCACVRLGSVVVLTSASLSTLPWFILLAALLISSHAVAYRARIVCHSDGKISRCHVYQASSPDQAKRLAHLVDKRRKEGFERVGCSCLGVLAFGIDVGARALLTHWSIPMV